MLTHKRKRKSFKTPYLKFIGIVCLKQCLRSRWSNYDHPWITFVTINNETDVSVGRSLCSWNPHFPIAICEKKEAAQVQWTQKKMKNDWRTPLIISISNGKRFHGNQKHCFSPKLQFSEIGKTVSKTLGLKSKLECWRKTLEISENTKSMLKIIKSVFTIKFTLFSFNNHEIMWQLLLYRLLFLDNRRQLIVILWLFDWKS